MDLAAFLSLVKKGDAELYEHLQSIDLDPQIFAAKWFLCLFVDCLPSDGAIRIWDVLIFLHHCQTIEEEEAACSNLSKDNTAISAVLHTSAALLLSEAEAIKRKKCCFEAARFTQKLVRSVSTKVSVVHNDSNRAFFY